MEGDGFIHVADFVTVVHYDKDKFPNGVKKFSIKEKDTEVVSPDEGIIAPPAWTTAPE